MPFTPQGILQLARSWVRSGYLSELSLHTASPTTGNELSGMGYARAPLLGGVFAFELPESWVDVPLNEDGAFVLSNGFPVTFPQATGSWATASHVAGWGAATGIPGASGTELLFGVALASSTNA